MSHQWPAETAFRRIDLYVRNQKCAFCETGLYVCSHRKRRLYKGRACWSCGWVIVPTQTARGIVARSVRARRWRSLRRG
jgi:Zn-finger protein